MDAVAVDFETANEKKSSACAIGVAWLKLGSIIRTESFLIKPPEEKFSHFNEKIHGITNFDVVNAEKFDVIWLAEISSPKAGKTLSIPSRKLMMRYLRGSLLY